MAVTLNASTSAGLIQTADTSGDISLQNNGTTGLNLTSGNLQFNSGYGSVATAYGCRAWVNFNGTGTVAIRASGNVTSITDNGTGDYTVNFTTAMPDANYSHNINASFSEATTGLNNRSYGSCAKLASSLRILIGYVSSTVGALTVEDTASVQVVIFR